MIAFEKLENIAFSSVPIMGAFSSVPKSGTLYCFVPAMGTSPLQAWRGMCLPLVKLGLKVN